MTRQLRSTLALVLIALTTFTGCHPTQPFYFHEDGDLSHYLDHATALEEPNYEQPRLEDVEYAEAPLTLSNPEFKEIWDLCLQEAISIAMHNSKVLRNSGGSNQTFFAQNNTTQITNDTLLRGPGNAATIYDSAISEAGTRETTGVDGVEAALSAFDAQARIQGSQPGGGLGVGGIATNTDRLNNFNGAQGPFNNTSQGGIEASLTKRTATGMQLRASSRTDHNRSNAFFTPIYSTYWEQVFQVEAVQPLLRGNGAAINRIPIVIARINTDVSLVDFEANVRNMVMDIEAAYWDLHAAYRALETAKVGRDSAHATWKVVSASREIKGAQEEAQAREQYFAFRAELETSLRNLYNYENRLRYLMGIAATDGRLIRPCDQPTAARISHEWRLIHMEALLRSPELRRQKWTIERRELELMTAKNQLLPQLDVGAYYRWYGAGDNLINADRNGLDFTGPAPGFAAQPGSTAFDVLTGGQFQESGFLFNFQMPVGFRRELAGVRASQLVLAREQSRLEDMELSVSHLLSAAVRELDYQYQAAQTHFNRWKASQAEVDAVTELYRGGKSELNLVLDAQRRRATSEIAYYAALSEYNKQIAFVHFRKGSLLEYNNVHLAEGPWADKAYWDAMEHARERDASYYLNYGYTRPGVISQGPVPQGPVSEYIGDMPVDGLNASDSQQFEQVPVPQPTPAERPRPGDDNPQQPGPITTRPEGPMLNAPRRAEVPRGSNNVATGSEKAFQWGSLGLETPPAPDGNGLRQASFDEPLR